MTRPASLSALPSSYNEFLYAPIGENPDGAMLTVLSVLARQNLDPWEQAADMSRMPHDTAARRLSSMITASHGQSTAADQAATADRLIALLPSRTASADSKREPDAASQGQLVVHRSATNNLMVIAIYICVMVLSQWMAASLFQKAPTAAVAAPAATSTLGEKIPSGPGDGPASTSPQ